MEKLDNYHNGQITSILVYCGAVLTSGKDRMVRIYGKTGKMTHEFDYPILSMVVAKNRKKNDVLILGFENGSVKLYDDFEFKEYGNLVRHKNKCITSVFPLCYAINDDSYNYLLIGDFIGRFSFWEFVNEKELKKK